MKTILWAQVYRSLLIFHLIFSLQTCFSLRFYFKLLSCDLLWPLLFLFLAERFSLQVDLEFTLNVSTVWVVLCLLLTLQSDTPASPNLWVVDWSWQAEVGGKARVSMLPLSVPSKNLWADVDPSSVRHFPLTPAVCAHFCSFHCVYQHVGHDENELNCDAFSVSDDSCK